MKNSIRLWMRAGVSPLEWVAFILVFIPVGLALGWVLTTALNMVNPVVNWFLLPIAVIWLILATSAGRDPA